MYLHGAHGRSDELDLYAVMASAPMRQTAQHGIALLAPQAPRTPPAGKRTTEWGHITERVMQLLYAVLANAQTSWTQPVYLWWSVDGRAGGLHDRLQVRQLLRCRCADVWWWQPCLLKAVGAHSVLVLSLAG